MSSKMVGRKSLPAKSATQPKSVEKVLTKIKKRNVDRLVEELYCGKKLTKEQKAKQKVLEDYLVKKLEKFSVDDDDSSSGSSDSECSSDCSCCSDSESCSCSDCCSSGTESDSDSNSDTDTSGSSDSSSGSSESSSESSESSDSSVDANTRRPRKSNTAKAKAPTNPAKGKISKNVPAKKTIKKVEPSVKKNVTTAKKEVITIKKEKPDADDKRNGKLDANNNKNKNAKPPPAVVIKTEPKERSRKTL